MDFDQTCTETPMGQTHYRLQRLGVLHLLSQISFKDKYMVGRHSFCLKTLLPFKISIKSIKKCQIEWYARKESMVVVQCRLKILSLGITDWYHLASLMMLNNYPHDKIFNPHITTINDSYIPLQIFPVDWPSLK